MPGVYPLDTDTALLGFVSNKAKQLLKPPGVQTSLLLHVLVLLASSYLGGLTNVTEVFQHDSGARGRFLYDTLT